MTSREVLPVHGTRKRVRKIIGLAIDIKDDLGHDIFVDYSPHVHKLSLRIYLGGWKRNRGCDKVWDMYLTYKEYEEEEYKCYSGTEHDVYKELDNMINYLEDLYITKEEN